MFRSHPTLRLLIPYLSGLLAAEAGFAFWVLAAAFFPGGPAVLGTRQAVRKFIPILMATAGLLMNPETARSWPVEGIVEFEGVVTDGPWTLNRYNETRCFQCKPVTGPDNGSCPVFFSGRSNNPIVPGDRIRVRGRLQGAAQKCSIDTRADLVEKITQDRRYLIHRGVYQLRRSLREGLAASLDRESASLAAAMLLGLSGTVDSTTKDLFRRTGTAHLLAISGLHMGLIYMMLSWILARFGPGKRLTFWIICCLLMAYVLISGCRIPVIRAYLVCIFYLYAARIDRRSDPFDVLFNASLVIVVMDPGAVEEISFQLSFAGYSAILLYLRSTRSMRRQVSRHRRQEYQRPKSAASRFVGKAVFLLGLSAASWLGTLPLTLHYFQRFIPWAPLINVLIFPLFMTALIAGAIHLSAVFLGLQYSVLTAWPAQTGFDLLCWALKRCDELPPGALDTPPLPAWAAGVAYLAMGAAILLVALRQASPSAGEYPPTDSDRGPTAFPRT